MPFIPSSTYSRVTKPTIVEPYSSDEDDDYYPTRLPPRFTPRYQPPRITPEYQPPRYHTPRLTPDYQPSYLGTSTPSPARYSRRIFPQSYESLDDEDDISTKDDSSVVFDANLSFVLGAKGQLRQHVTPVPAHLERETASNALSSKISNFLQRTDHVMDEWKRVGGKKDKNQLTIGKNGERSKSATNIMIKGFLSRGDSVSKSLATKDGSEDCNTDAEIDEV